MKHPDLILLHPPSIYDFRQKPIIYGPISNVIPATPIFEMYPLGFVSLSNYFEKHNYSIRIINLAYRMLINKRFDVEKMLKKLQPVAFGIDLHWLPHCQGSLEVAKILKKYHPTIPIIFGGLSASYYYRELITYPFVDYIIRGDSTEEPFLQLLKLIKEVKTPSFKQLANIPNLVWKDKDNVKINELSYVPSSLPGLDYFEIIKKALKYKDILSYVPFRNWLNYPITAVFSQKGCVNNCLICGGSKSFYENTCHRQKPALRPPELLAEDIHSISYYLKSPIMVLGDIQLAGKEYINQFFKKLKEKKVKNNFVFEFFEPASYDFLTQLKKAVSHFNLQISPESHDERIRKIFGRNYSNQALEECLSSALKLGCQRIDLFFMIGLPEQTENSVKETLDYCGYLLEKYQCIHPYIAPLGPFLDPGSLLFEQPEKYGYKLFYQTLKEHRQALLNTSLKTILNYETKWLSRKQIVSLSYQAALTLNQLKLKFRLLKPKIGKKIENQIKESLVLMEKLDSINSYKNLQKLQQKIDKINHTSFEKKEMEWQSGFLNFHFFRILLRIVKELVKK